MHADEVHTDVPLVRRLLAAQFPQWADLPIERVASAGTDNAIYRLGGDMAVRLPRIAGATGQIEKERLWLPKLAPHLPLAIPVPLAVGDPGEGYPWQWCISPWLDGDDATAEHLRDLGEAAVDLAAFIAALQRIDTTGGPAPGRHNFFRGVPLAMRDTYTRDAISRLDGIVDTGAVTAAWEAALQAPAWDRPPVWVHGDLLPGNLLAARGRLSGVIDFGGLGVGDPAVELIVAWTLFSGESRDAFRAALSADDATWARGRGWALSTAVVALPYYLNTNPAIVARSRHQIEEVLAEHNY
ncbi:MAG: aminoglycoside phosphotransferase family protein [Chloroflexi bacterium]|nr:aminoglycoside phosphotransferase family protein [Chloroflexota bacterium]